MRQVIHIINGKKFRVNIVTDDDFCGDIGGGGEFIPPTPVDPSTFWNNISQTWNTISLPWNSL